jgi:hypothetical protein
VPDVAARRDPDLRFLGLPAEREEAPGSGRQRLAVRPAAEPAGGEFLDPGRALRTPGVLRAAGPRPLSRRRLMGLGRCGPPVRPRAWPAAHASNSGTGKK